MGKTLDFKINEINKDIASKFEDYENGYKVYSLNDDVTDPLTDENLSDIVNHISDTYKCSCVSISNTQSSFSSKDYLMLFKKE